MDFNDTPKSLFRAGTRFLNAHAKGDRTRDEAGRLSGAKAWQKLKCEKAGRA
jgi:hypothetical protein